MAQEHKGINPVAAGTAGAVIGAGIAVAATAAMQNVKTREKIMETLESVREKAMQRVPHMVGMEKPSIDKGVKMGKAVTKKLKVETVKSSKRKIAKM